jgi:hypothetical protein
MMKRGFVATLVSVMLISVYACGSDSTTSSGSDPGDGITSTTLEAIDPNIPDVSSLVFNRIMLGEGRLSWEVWSARRGDDQCVAIVFPKGEVGDLALPGTFRGGLVACVPPRGDFENSPMEAITFREDDQTGLAVLVVRTSPTASISGGDVQDLVHEGSFGGMVVPTRALDGGGASLSVSTSLGSWRCTVTRAPGDIDCHRSDGDAVGANSGTAGLRV